MYKCNFQNIKKNYDILPDDQYVVKYHQEKYLYNCYIIIEYIIIYGEYKNILIPFYSDNKIAKMQNYENRAEADAHVARVLPNYPDAFVIDNPSPYVMDYTTVDVVAKTLTYDSVGYDSDTVMNDWKASMQETDDGMPRYMEDLITANSDFTIPEKMKTRYDEKIALRATKP